MAVETGRKVHEKIKLTLDPQSVNRSSNEKACAMMKKLVQEGYLYGIALHFACQWFFHALIILD